MTYQSELQTAVGGIDVHMSPRACQKCHTTVTSQWRYGLSGKVLLCNACGIRWKRKNRTTDKRKLKPGPKRTRQCPSIPTTLPSTYMNVYHPATRPSLESMFYNRNAPMYHSLNSGNISSSSTITEPHAERGHRHYQHHQQSTEEYRRPSSKMNVGSLVSPTNATTPDMSSDARRPSKVRQARQSSPISIRNLLNCSDEDGSNTVCSTSAYRALRC